MADIDHGRGDSLGTRVPSEANHPVCLVADVPVVRAQ